MDQDAALLKRRTGKAVGDLMGAFLIEKAVFALLVVVFTHGTGSLSGIVLRFGAAFFSFFSLDFQCGRLPLSLFVIVSLVRVWTESVAGYFAAYVFIAGACYLGLGFLSPDYAFLFPGPKFLAGPTVTVVAAVLVAGAIWSRRLVRSFTLKRDAGPS